MEIEKNMLVPSPAAENPLGRATDIDLNQNESINESINAKALYSSKRCMEIEKNMVVPSPAAKNPLGRATDIDLIKKNQSMNQLMSRLFAVKRDIWKLKKKHRQ